MTENITVSVTSRLKDRTEAFRKKYYQDIPFNSFLGFLLDVGLKEEEMWQGIRDEYRLVGKDAPLCKCDVAGERKENGGHGGAGALPAEGLQLEGVTNGYK